MEIKLKDNDTIIIIHHWDCDGILSCILLKNYLLELNKNVKIDMVMPKIGNYYIDDEIFNQIENKNPYYIFIVDMALPKENILDLKKISNSVFIFDHHKQNMINEVEHINPIAIGKSGKDFPSAGWVINNYFNKKQEILSVIGAIGDQEDRVKNNATVVRVLDDYDISFNEAMEIVKNINSSYIINDVREIYKTIGILENKDNIRKVLDDESFITHRKKIEEKIEDITNNIEKNNSFIYCRFSNSYHIISDVTRLLSRKYPKHLIIATNSSGSSCDNIYFRRKEMDIDLAKIVGYANSKNYNAGGKEEVAGVYTPKHKTSDFIDNCLNIIF